MTFQLKNKLKENKMAIVTSQRGKIKHVTSSFFKDISLLRNSEVDTGYRQRYREKSDFDLNKLQLAYAVQKIILFKKGCRELTEFANKLNSHELASYCTDYIGSDYEEYTGPFNLEDMMKKDTDRKPMYRTSGDL
jgi:hypothetical protein